VIAGISRRSTPVLRAEDRGRLRAEAAELPLVEPRWVSHAFSFAFNRGGARAVGDELRRRGFDRIWVGEEITGDSYWHVTGWHRQALTHRVVANTRHQMEALARLHGGVYDGWKNAHGFATPQPRTPRERHY
jgi:hypothetical protein